MGNNYLNDLRIGFRALARAPILFLTIVATVGLGIGATASVFAALDAVLLRPLPYQNADRLVRIYTEVPPNRFPFSVADYLALTAQQTRFDGIAGYATQSLTYSDGMHAERVRGRAVTWTYFGLLGIRPTLGRDFVESDGRPGTTPVVIASTAFWRTHLSGISSGRPIRLDGSDYTLVGVLPPTPGPLEQGVDLYVATEWPTPMRKGPFFISVLGRLRPHADRSAAAEELRAINRRIFPIWRASFQDDRATWGLIELKAQIVGDLGPIPTLSLTAVVLIWVLACANASNLLLARIASRRRELAVRAALGASRRQLIGHLLAESAWLAVASAIVGGAIAWWAIDMIRSIGGDYLPRAPEIGLNAHVATVLAAATIVSVLVFGALPAVLGTRAVIERALRESGRWSSGGVEIGRLRRVLVGAQFAIATPLLVVAAVLILNLDALGRADLGFDRHNLLSGSLLLPTSSEAGYVRTFWEELQTRVAALPGVAGVGFADGRPPDEVNNFNNFDLEDSPTPPGSLQPVTPSIAVTPAYFHVLGLRLLEGRLFDDHDADATSAQVAVVDHAWAARFFSSWSPVGRRLRQGGCTTCPFTTIVGVVSDVRYMGIDQPDEGTLFVPMSPLSRARFLLVRTTGDAAAVLPAVSRTIRSLDPAVPFSNALTMDEQIARALQGPRWASVLAAVFAGIALALSLIGIYGIMAHYVEQHAKEVGIRLALGGTRGEVVRPILGSGMKVVSAGLCVGLGTAIAVVRVVAALLAGVSPRDPGMFVGVTALLLAAALLTCLVPAARVVRRDPGLILREE